MKTPTIKLFLALLAFLALIKQSQKQFKKYLRQVNIADLLDIYFLLNEFL